MRQLRQDQPRLPLGASRPGTSEDWSPTNNSPINFGHRLNDVRQRYFPAFSPAYGSSQIAAYCRRLGVAVYTPPGTNILHISDSELRRLLALSRIGVREAEKRAKASVRRTTANPAKAARARGAAS